MMTCSALDDGPQPAEWGSHPDEEGEKAGHSNDGLNKQTVGCHQKFAQKQMLPQSRGSTQRLSPQCILWQSPRVASYLHQKFWVSDFKSFIAAHVLLYGTGWTLFLMARPLLLEQLGMRIRNTQVRELALLKGL